MRGEAEQASRLISVTYSVFVGEGLGCDGVSCVVKRMTDITPIPNMNKAR